MSNFIDTLSSLPLFEGISAQTMVKTTGKFRFGFTKYSAGETIVQAGDACRSLLFIISGNVESTTLLHNLNITIKCRIEPGAVLFPDFLMGRSTRYPATVVCLSDVSVLEIPKEDILSIICFDRVYMFNFLNMLSTDAQKAYSLTQTHTLKEAIGQLLRLFTDKHTSTVDISVCEPNVDLASKLGLDPIAYRAELDSLAAQGLIQSADETHITVAHRKNFPL